MTSKQRANLRSMAGGEDTILQIGKENLGDNLVKAVSDALEARELIKISVLKGSELSVAEAADSIAKKTRSEVVSTIGNKIILYRRSHAANVKHLEF